MEQGVIYLEDKLATQHKGIAPLGLVTCVHLDREDIVGDAGGSQRNGDQGFGGE